MPSQISLKFVGIFVILKLLLIVSSKSVPSIATVNGENLRQLESIEASMDASADPCDDFYSYACGNWPRYQRYSEDYIDTFELLDYNYYAALTNILHSTYPDVSKIRQQNQSVIDKVMIYYHSCKHTETDAFHGYFWEIKPGLSMEWPLLEELRAPQQGDHREADINPLNYKQFDIWSLLGQFHSYGFNDILIHLELPKVISVYSVFGLAVAKNHALSPNIIEEFFEFSQIPSSLRNKYRQDIRQTDIYWECIYQNFTRSQDLEIKSYGQLKRTYPYLARYFDIVLPTERLDEQTVVSLNMEYIRFLYETQWQPAQIRNLCNYFMIKIFQHLKTNADKNCGEALRKRMPLAVDYLYHQRILLPQAQNFTKDMSEYMNQLYHQFNVTISENNLRLNHEQLQAITQKLSKLPINIGNLPENIDDAFVRKYYIHVPDLDINNFYKNDLLLRRQQVLTSLTCPKGMSCSTKIGITPIYIEEDDMVVVPMGSLSPPMYHPNFHPLFSLSLLGTFIAHEFAHAIDLRALTLHRAFEQFHQEFYQQTKIRETISCLERQESEDKIDDRLADLVGARVAYTTYMREYKTTLNFTAIPKQQLYFLNLAQFFCGRPDGINFVDHDSHETRLQDITMNMNQFAEAFQCAEGSRMNPRWKCRFY